MGSFGGSENSFSEYFDLRTFRRYFIFIPLKHLAFGLFFFVQVQDKPHDALTSLINISDLFDSMI